jgi:hypothetical protein
MSKDFSKDLPALLGKAIDDADVTSYLKTLDPAEAVRLTSLKEPRWISEDAGLVVYAQPKTRRITDVFTYAEGHEGYKQFKGPLPHGIDFSMSMDAVKACFPRAPNFSSPEHCTWDFEEYRIIVRFKSDAIIRVTLTSDF